MGINIATHTDCFSGQLNMTELEVWCLSGSVIFGELAKEGAGSMILASNALAPM